MSKILEPDWTQERPESTGAAIEKLWGHLRISCVPEGELSAGRLLEALRRTHVNGGAEFRTFRLEGDPAFDWFMSRNRWEEIDFPKRLLQSSVVTAALPEVCDSPVDDPFGFEWGSAFTFAGELAQTLAQGGAYVKHAGGPGEAWEIADEFRTRTFGDRFEEVLILKSWRPWSAWFCDVAWDSTWLILDKRFVEVSVLAVTDTD
ncbi:hypothetical protein [Alienimonas californiensis]|uniref:Uncharacterized protein n=1 Tax=Alienimonas californiensis TaxID=2527989 RepID=A0A517P579_9PLAN|nr:hypothetical protein [Alienimonas californiensis]QDT14506.1 hypothetical protein CA12_05800 [Alienimonas californiensis]